MRGIAPEVQHRLYEEGFPGEFVDSLTAFRPLWYSEMPIGDAVEVVRYLAATAEGFERFSPGLPLVAGPIDIAMITQNEGFRWVQRKEQVGRRQLVPGSFRDIHHTEPAI